VNALRRFLVTGMEDADRRLASTLRPQPLDAADRYLRGSALISAVDRLTRILQRWWHASAAQRLLAAARQEWSRQASPSRHRALAVLLLTAVASHVFLMVFEGRYQGWFWLVVPAMTTVLAFLLLAGSRSQRLSN